MMRQRRSFYRALGWAAAQATRPTARSGAARPARRGAPGLGSGCGTGEHFVSDRLPANRLGSAPVFR
jgi:hypothetical protein